MIDTARTTTTIHTDIDDVTVVYLGGCPSRPLIKRPDLCDGDIRHYSADCPNGCGAVIVAQWYRWDDYLGARAPADHDAYCVWDDTHPDGSAGGWSVRTLADAQGAAAELLRDHMLEACPLRIRVERDGPDDCWYHLPECETCDEVPPYGLWHSPAVTDAPWPWETWQPLGGGGGADYEDSYPTLAAMADDLRRMGREHYTACRSAHGCGQRAGSVSDHAAMAAAR